MQAHRTQVTRRLILACALASVFALASAAPAFLPTPAEAAGSSTKTHKDEGAYQKKVQECNGMDKESQNFKDCMAAADQL